MTETPAEPDTLWVVDDLSVHLPHGVPEGEPHPERGPIGPFTSRLAAEEWAVEYVGGFGGSGSWLVLPLRTPPGQPVSILIKRPTVPYGPAGRPENEATADYLTGAADRVSRERYWGSNLSATITGILRECAEAVRRQGPYRG